MTATEGFWNKRPNLKSAIIGNLYIDLASKLQSDDSKFYVLAAQAAIKDPEKFYSFYAKGQTKDIKWAIARFFEVFDMTRQIWDTAAGVNNNLWDELTEDSGVVKAVATPTGWGAPRLLILLKEKCPDANIENVLVNSLTKSATAAEFLSMLAENIFTFEDRAVIQAGEIMDFVLKKHQAEEQGTWNLYFKVIDQLKTTAPKLWSIANNLYESKKKETNRPGWMIIMDKYNKQNQRS